MSATETMSTSTGGRTGMIPRVEEILALCEAEAAKRATVYNANKPRPKRGEEIFAGMNDYPREWSEFIGQAEAVDRIYAACYSARVEGRRTDHILLASGLHGIGKTSLAKLIAYQLKVGLVELSGAISAEEARPVLRSMQDEDVLFIDEVHLTVAAGKAKAEWLLHLLADGRLLTAAGEERMPNITVIAATTDVQKLPQTMISRFPVRPVLVTYTVPEAAAIAARMATKLGFGLLIPFPSVGVLVQVATAANCEPREVRQVLIALRDSVHTGTTPPVEDFDLGVAMRWCKLTPDGLNQVAQNYLTTLLTTFEGTAGEKVIASAIGEPGGVRHTEQTLVGKGLLVVTGQGRKLTDAGVARTVGLLHEGL